MKMTKVILAICLCCSLTGFVWASSIAEKKPTSDTKKVSEVAENEKSSKDIKPSKDSFNVKSGASTYDIPKDSNKSVSISLYDGNKISYSLPSEVSNSKGKLVDDAVVYNNDSSGTSLALQKVEEEDGDAMESNITINDSNAPKEYRFKYDLGDRYQLIKGEDYPDVEAAQPGYVYIISKNDYVKCEDCKGSFPKIVLAIEPAWAKDANGNDIKTSFGVQGDCLIQKVDFNKNTAFPVIAG